MGGAGSCGEGSEGSEAGGRGAGDRVTSGPGGCAEFVGLYPGRRGATGRPACWV